MKIIKIKAKNVFTRTKLGCDWTVNQYVGCGHGCLYCYAASICKWLFRIKKKPSYRKWGTWVEAKVNAPELVKGKKVKGSVWMSSMSDPYQPVEKKLKLTRKILKNLDKDTILSIQTKSDLILRDIDLFKQFKNIEIGFTINGFKGEIKKLFEPYSSSHKQRLKALKTIKQNGLKTYVFVSPIIPYLVDVKRCIQETRKFADYYWFEVLNLRGAGKEFRNLLRNKFPKSYKTMVEEQKFQKFIKDLRKNIEKSGLNNQRLIIH